LLHDSQDHCWRTDDIIDFLEKKTLTLAIIRKKILMQV